MRRYEAIAVQTALRQHLPVSDRLFDRQYPRRQQLRSEVHWTPVAVAIRVAQLLADSPGGHILDVGAGVGKACIVGALTTRALWYGMEQNLEMVRTARRVARRLGVDHRTCFLAGEATAMDWSPFGGFYFYNPFAEALFARSILEPGVVRTAYLTRVEAVEKKLDQLRTDTRVATYHGFGGDLPDSFELVEREEFEADAVCLWIRRGRHRRRAGTPSSEL